MFDGKGNNVIIAPHCDDEIIGCFEVLMNTQNPPVIVYDASMEQERREEALKLRDNAKITMQFFASSVPMVFINPTTTLYFPDPVYEMHPLHRKWGSIGEQHLRQGLNVIFYSTLMNAPYIHESRRSREKEELLNKLYASQSDLWKYEKKYVLFEGYNKWLIKV